MKIVLASRNAKKIKELRELLCESIPDIEILSLDDVGIYGEIEENGETFEENAYIKASVAAESGYIGIGDDSGLVVNALGGAPGVYSARYAGGHGDDEANNAFLLKNLKDKTDRSAKFVSVVACVFPEDREKGNFFRGETEGEILKEYRGEGGFGYDPLFYYAPMNKTYAEMTAEEKNSISHRGKAMRLLSEFLCKKVKG
ncbi:MAG: RdgB/HAM1 family non-canonical purine NTP pyrophosphatase [Ruminococcaceae bacterium]|nr:RdgB/HAM1 family non-canonical purine NTP pyrophosphatase [Oscillospiraceae bacterium]